MTDWWGTLDIDGWSLFAAVAVLIATWIVARLARSGARRVVARVPNLSLPVQVGAVRITGYAVWLIGIGVALSFLGASVQPVLAVAVIVAVVLALMLRGVADNFAAGMVLQTRRPIDVGDLVTSGDFTGEVLEVNGRSVIVRTGDGRTVHLPNATVLQEPLVNHSAHGARRSEVQVRIADAAGSGLDEASGDDEPGASGGIRSAIGEAAVAVPGVHHREAVHVLPVSRGGGREVYRVQFWHHPAHGVTVTGDVVDALAELLDRRGIAGAVTSEPPPPALAAATEV
ncbi:mechanosensitive ion channel [Agromyces sp. CFH 90414]|uniref:Mechanosensitive ion channel n=1 Tax=Agromyces agglutinans TaxID=2662258 RepID=A0A6I2F9S5_9MICO|nr:mechanosensitive ion channel domain-containing protein [Agromyces agglutinans]MRG59106.1 mechanosensitive ion channel [Agromyces agglutinans]